MKSPKIGILVVAYNAETTLGSVLQRIPAPIMAKISEIFVFDDASTDTTHAVGKQLEAEEFHEGKLSIYRNDVNQMYGGNQRRGYQYAISKGLDIVVLLHGDGQYAPEIMQDLLTPLETGEADMVMGSRMLIPGAARKGNMPLYKFVGNKILTTLENCLAGTNLSEFHSGYRAYSVHALRNIPLDSMTTNWHFDTQIILEFLKRGYRINEVPIPTYYGDEICRVNGIPYAMHCINETMMYALKDRWRRRPDARGGSAGNSLTSNETAARSMHHYRLKNDPLSSHQQIVKLVRELNQGPILDVGSAQGMFGQLMQGSGLEIDAVEPNPEWAAAAAPLYRKLYVGTIESADLPKAHYRVVVCGDVLEHTLNPAAILQQIQAHCTSDATFIISLPNVAHIAVRFLLLCGYFPKMERGILDKTHLHFFTRETATQLLQSAGLRVERKLATAAPLQQIWPRGDGSLIFNAIWHLQHIAVALFRGLFAYQWVLVARRQS